MEVADIPWSRVPKLARVELPSQTAGTFWIVAGRPTGRPCWPETSPHRRRPKGVAKAWHVDSRRRRAMRATSSGFSVRKRWSGVKLRWRGEALERLAAEHLGGRDVRRKRPCAQGGVADQIEAAHRRYRRALRLSNRPARSVRSQASSLRSLTKFLRPQIVRGKRAGSSSESLRPCATGSAPAAPHVASSNFRRQLQTVRFVQLSPASNEKAALRRSLRRPLYV